jgi:hypothetical protein
MCVYDGPQQTLGQSGKWSSHSATVMPTRVLLNYGIYACAGEHRYAKALNQVGSWKEQIGARRASCDPSGLGNEVPQCAQSAASQSFGSKVCGPMTVMFHRGSMHPPEVGLHHTPRNARSHQCAVVCVCVSRESSCDIETSRTPSRTVR